MKLEQLIAALRETGGEYPETLLDDVSGAYQEDFGVVNGKVDSLAAENEALKAENLTLKSHNYDLIMAGSPEPGASEEPEPSSEESEGEEPTGEDDDENIEDLFVEH